MSAVVGSDKTKLNPGDPVLTGTPGDDTFTAIPGNEAINALGGNDTIFFNFRLIDATVTYSGNAVIIDSASSHTVVTGFQTYVFTDGTVNNNDGSPLVDDLFYYSQYHDVWNAHIDADVHYAQFGWKEGRDPDAFFNTNLYLGANPDVKALNTSPLVHFDLFGWKESRLPSPDFDPRLYLISNPDVKAAHIDPLAHFLQYGGDEGRQPSPASTPFVGANGFDYFYYLMNNPDVAAAGVDAFQHFQTLGWHEGRNPNAYFDVKGYLATYPDVAAAGVNPLTHYSQIGWTEGRNPSPAFDSNQYLLHNPDVAAAHVDPLMHFLRFGIFEGRQAYADPISDTNAATNIALEGATNGTAVGLTASWGGWISPALTYSLDSDSSGGGFAINATTGVVTVADGTKLNFESSGASHTYTVSVVAHDGALSNTQNFTIIVGDVAPSIPADADGTANSVVEGAANGTVVGITASSSDPNGPAPAFSLITDSSGGGFQIDPSTGVVTVANASLVNFETPGNSYTITVQASDGTLASTQDFVIPVADVAPTTPADANGATNTVAEGAAAGTAVGLTVSSTDINGPAVTFALTADSSGGGFQIDASTGVVTVADGARLDYESAPGHAYTVTAQASDGTLTSSQSFTIAVSNLPPSTPADNNGAANNVAEGSASSSTVGVTALSVDPSGGQVTYSLTDTDGGRFAINPSTGVVTVANASLLNFESGSLRQVTVKAADSSGLFTTQNFTIVITDVAPPAATDSNAAADGVTEGAASGTAVGITASSNDVNGGTVAYTLTNNAGGRFAIDGSTGIVTVANAALVNFEDNVSHSYTITVQASDGTLASTQDFVIPVADVAPTQPTDGNIAINTVAEGATTGTTVGVTVASTDVNGGALTYAFAAGGDAGGRFQINSVTGVVSVSAAGAATIDYETAGGGTHNYSITVQASDGTLVSSTQNFTIGVTNVAPTAPVDSNGASGGTIQEGSATGTLVGITAASTDPGGTAIVYSLTDDAGGRFQINASSGVVSAGPSAGLIDFETGAASYNITVRASDGSLANVQTFAVAVTNANPSTPSDANGAANGVTEGVAPNQATGVTVQATDPGGTTIVYSLTDDAGGRFQINSSSGVVTTGPNAGLIDFEGSGGSYSITAQASDGATGTSAQTFSIAVADVAPGTWSDINAGADTVIEDAANNTPVGIQAHATDVNGGTVVYSFAAAADSANGAFKIDSATGVISVANHALVDFESSGGSYNVLVTGSTVGGTATSTQGFVITVTDQAPSTPIDNAAPTGGTVVEAAPAGTTVGITALSTDVNSPSSAVTYSLTNDAGGLFTIGSSSGIVTVTAAGAAGIDFESSGGSYAITVRASDGTQSSTQNFSITVTDAAPFQPTDSNGNANTVAVDAADNSTVGVTLFSTDPNSGTLTYALTAAHVGVTPITNPFQVDPNSGVVTLAPGHINLSGFAGQTITIAGVAKDPSLATSASQDFNIFVANNQLNVDLDQSDDHGTGNAYAASFNEQGAAVSIGDTDVKISNIGNPGVTTATSSTIVLTNAQLGDGFTFAAAAPAGITRTVTTSAGTITVTLTGSAAYTAYETAIKQIQFTTTGDPTSDAPNTTPRAIQVTVTDSTGTSPFALSTITPVAVNDPPVLLSNGSPSPVNYTENALATALLANGTITDPDHPGNFSGGTFTVAITANAVVGQDQIVLLGGTNFAVSGTTLLHNGTAIGTLSGLGTTSASVSAFTAAATPTVVNELAHAFGYQNSSDNPTVATDRTVTFTFQDGGHTGGSAPGLANTVVVTQNVHVIAVNDAPVAANGTVSGNEDAAGISGTAVATDVDNASVTYSLVGGANGGAQHGTVSFTNAATGAYTYIPAANFNGTDTFTFKAYDGSLDSNNATITVTVGSVNDAPAGTDNAVSTAEDTFYTFTAADFGFTDPNDVPANSLAAVKITQLPGTGTLADNGVAVTTNQFISVADINKGLLMFTPAANSTTSTTFKFAVQDDGGTANSGVDLDQSPNTMTLNVTAVNDAPVNTVPFDTKAITQNAAAVAINGLSVTDIDSAPLTTTLVVANGLLTVSDGGGGALINGGASATSATITITGTISQVQQALGNVSYASGTLGADTLTMTTTDGSGGSDIDKVAIEVSPPIQNGLTGELFYITRESPNLNDNVVGQINSNDPGTGASAIHFAATSNAVNDIGVDTAVGYYFVLDGDLAGQTLSSYALGGNTAAQTFTLSPGDTFDAIAVETFYRTIFVSDLCTTPNEIGIKEFNYFPDGTIGDSGNFLINQTTVPSFGHAIDLAVDAAARLLYYVDSDPTGYTEPGANLLDPGDDVVIPPTNAIYVVNYDNGNIGPLNTGSATPPTATLLSSISQFPTDPGDPNFKGFIEAVAVDDRGTISGAGSTNDDIIYFVTSTGGLYYIVRGAGTTANLVTGAPTLSDVGAHIGLSFDYTTHQLWITNQDHTNNNDSIIKAQLNVAGTAIAGTTAYDLTALTGVLAPDGTTVPGQTAFATLPSITVHNTAYTEGTPVLVDPAFTLFDPDLTIKSATITVTGGFFGSGDTLTINSIVAGITDTLTTDANGNLVLTLDGPQTIGQFMGSIVNTLTFDSGENPTNFGHNTTRTVTWHFNDGAFGDPYTDGNTKTSTITLTPQNDAPVAAAGVNSGNEDHAIVGQAVATDVDNTAAQLTYSLVGANGGALHGTVTITAAGAYIYAPNADYNGPDSFNFRVNDGTVNSNTAAISITVNSINDAPAVTATTLLAVNEDTTNPPGETVANLFTGHFTDIDTGSSLAGIAVSANAANAGTQGVWQYDTHDASGWHNIGAVTDATALALDAATSLRFVPAANFNGTPPALSVYGLDNTFAAAFTIGVTTSLIDASVNGGTTAISDNSVAISTSITAVNDLPVLDLDANDSGANGATGVSGADFAVNYIVSGPPAAIADVDTTITDVDNTNIQSATITLTNHQTNDTLAISGALPAGITASSYNSGTGVLTLSGSASLAAYQTALHQIVFDNPLASPDASGDRIVHVTVNDGSGDSSQATTTIHVTQDTAPVAADDANAGTAGGAPNLTGNVIVASDTDAQDPQSALVVATVRTGAEAGAGTSGTVGNALVGTYGALTLNFDGSYTYQIDNNNAALKALGSIDPPAHDIFTYTVRDTAGLTDLAQLDISIAGANDPPTANPDAVSATEKGGIGNLTAGVDPAGNVISDVGPGKDTDPDNDPLVVQGAALGTQAGPLNTGLNTALHGAGANDFGTFTVTANGSYTYAVNQTNTLVQGLRTFAQTLTDTFSYTISDGNPGGTSTTQVTVTIHGQNDNPVAVNDTASALEAGGTANGTAGTNPSGNLLTNDTDVDAPNTLNAAPNGETKLVQGVEFGDNPADVVSTGVAAGITGTFGTLTVNANGTYGYVVDNSGTNLNVEQLQNGGSGTDIFTYTIRDTIGATSTAKLTITVSGANDAPVANADGTYVVSENRATAVTAPTLLANDTDVDTAAGSLTAIKNGDTVHGGVVTVNAAGTFSVSYVVANNNYLGTDTFQYHTNDNGTPNLSSGAATVTLDVQPLVWYIDDSVGAVNDATHFTTVAGFVAANNAASATSRPDIIYVRAGDDGNYSSSVAIALKNGQVLLGQGVDLAYAKTLGGTGTLETGSAGQTPTIHFSGAIDGVTLAQNNTLKGFNIDTGSNGAAVGIEDSNAAGAAGSVGALNIALVGISGTGKAIDIDQGGTLNVSLSSIASTGSNSEGIQLGGIAGTNTIGGSFAVTGTTSITNADTTGIQVSTTAANATFNFGTSTTVTDNAIGSGHNGNGIDLATGIGATNGFTFGNTSITTDGGFGLKAANTGTLTFGGTNSINATGGAAVDLTNTALSNATFSTVSSSGSANYGISIVTPGTGAFTANGGTIGTADLAGIHIGNGTASSGGSADFTYAGAINSSNGIAADIEDRTGGAVSLSGTINHTSGGDKGIVVSGNTGGTIGFTGQTTIASTTATGVDLTGNTGATINFGATGNGLDITTTSGTGFNATGGGTVNVTASGSGANGGNTITSGTGTALNIDHTTIGASNVTFQSISANGASSGIALNTTGTSGGLTVTGLDGPDANSFADAGSGGTIQNTTTHGISLTSTSNVSLAGMSIHNTGDHGIFGDGVNNFTFRDGTIFNFGNASPAGGSSEDAMHFESTNTANTAAGHGLTGTVIIQRDTIGADGHFTLTPFPSLPENKGIVIRNHNDAALNMTVTGTTFTQISNDGIDAQIDNGAANLKVDGSTSDGANVFSQINGRAINFMNATDNTSDQTLELTVKNNTFDLVGIAARWDASARTTLNARFLNNAATNVTNDTIRSESDASIPVAGHPATVNATIANNTFGGGSVFISAHRSSIENISFTNNTNIGGTAAGVGGAGATGVHTGINVRSDRGSTVNIDLLNNTGTADGSVAQAQSALDFQTTNNGGGASTISAKIIGNTLTENPDTAGQQVISIDTVSGQGDVYLEGWNGSSPATYSAFLIANNTLNGSVKALADDPSHVHAGTGRANIPALPPAPLLAAAGGVESSSSGPGETHLTQAQLDSVVSAAISNWAAVGLSAAQLAVLQHVTYGVADIFPGWLGASTSGHVAISINAAGYGWFIDPTPRDNAEFAHAASATHLTADPTEAPAGHMDLLTTVMHEMGEQLGLADLYDDASHDNLLYVNLTTGERRLPGASDAARANEIATVESAQAAEAALPAEAQAPAGTPILFGTAGNDALDVNAGANIFFAGAGADAFVFDQTVLATVPTAPIAHIADYSALQGDIIDLSAMYAGALGQIYLAQAGSGNLPVQLVEDASGTFATLEAYAGFANMTAIAQLDGVHAGDAVDVILDPAHVAHLHAGLLI